MQIFMLNNQRLIDFQATSFERPPRREGSDKNTEDTSCACLCILNIIYYII